MARGDFLVDTVNPKLKNYNKPLTLAIAIAVFTLFSTLGLFGIMINQCDGNQTLVGGDFSDVDIAFKEGSVGKCIYYVQISKYDNGRLTNGKCLWTRGGVEVTYCDDWGEGDQKIDPQSVLEPCSSDYDNDPYSEAVIQIRYKWCPPWMPTLGAALGYTGFIELFFTGLIILPLLSCGCIKNGKHSSQALSVKEWVKEMYGQKDTAKEVGEHVTSAAWD